MGLAVNIQSRKGLWVSQWGRPVVLMGYKNDGNRSKTFELEKENRKISAYTLVALFKSGVRNSPKSYQGSNGTDGHFPIP